MFKIIKRILNWTGPYKKRVYLGFIFSFFQSICITLPIVISAKGLQYMLDDYHGTKALTSQTIWLLLLFILIAILGRFLFSYLKAVYQESIGYELVASHRIQLGNTLKGVSLGFFNKYRTGDINSIVTTDLSFVELMAMKMIDIVVNGYIMTFTMILFLLFYNPIMALIAIAGVILSMLFLRLLQKHSRKNAPVHQQSQHELVNNTLEYLRGMTVVKSFNQEGVASRNINEAFKNSKNVNIRIQKSFGIYNVGHRMGLKLASVLLVLVASSLVLSGDMQLADLFLITLFSFV
ncbi:ABC transporter transmembrane domain-containing protein [Bacillus pretiosus]|uniref:ABC transporter transmembrane domain-containing protein n=1 Tax=Bacillus pretiosus TaxID=2983392 RepID=UPI003D655239